MSVPLFVVHRAEALREYKRYFSQEPMSGLLVYLIVPLSQIMNLDASGKSVMGADNLLKHANMRFSL